MSVIVSEKFHVHNARQFVESLSESANDVYYLFVGRPTPWPDSESSPPTPDDSVANTTFAFWNDMIAARRIKPADVAYVIPRYDWHANAQFSMYDSRVCLSTLLGNTEYPFYVKTSTNEVFKCIFDGRSNNSSGPANSTSEPTTVGQSDITALTSSGGGLVWKYLYTVGDSPATGTKFLTSGYMPVSATFDTLDANGDVEDDGTNQYDVFHAARITGNGAIYRVVVEDSGSGYDGAIVTITGDGTGAEAEAVVSSGRVTEINMVSYGSGYSYANVSIAANATGNGATAEAIISPRTVYSNLTAQYYVTNHGINLLEELGAKRVMLYVELAGNSENMVATGNDYRRIGIVRNPQLYGTSNVATGNVYSQTLDLTLISASGTFATDEIVWQAYSNAWGVVVESITTATETTLKLTNVRGTFINTGNSQSAVLGIGNGLAAGQNAAPGIVIPSTPDAFPSNAVAPSGATAYVSDIAYPDLSLYTGTILYADHRAPITRSNNQTEILRTILTF